jgi:hypothetical protein
VSTERGTWSDTIFIDHAQTPKAHEVRIVVIGERERVVRIESTMIGVAPLFTSTTSYHLKSPFPGRFPCGLRRKYPQLFEQGVGLAFLVVVQDSHNRFQFRGMSTERLFHHASSFGSQVQDLGSPVAR